MAQQGQRVLRNRPAARYRLLSVALATLLVTNPVVLFLLLRNPWLAIGIPLASVAAMLWTCSNRRWRLGSAYLFNALAVVSVFAHGEVLLVHAFPERVVENLYTIEDGYYFNRPHLDQTFTGKEFSVRYRTNAQGFRIAESQDGSQLYERADWLVIGDSFTQGAQVAYGELFTTLLNERFPDRIVVNAGISGLGLGHEFNYYEKAGHQLGADLVILQISPFNDFMNVEPGNVGFSDRLMAHSAFIRLLLQDFKFTDPKELPLGRWAEPFQSDPQANIDLNVFDTRPSPAKERDLNGFRVYMRRFKEAVEGRGGKLVVVLVPTREQVYPRYLDEVVRAYGLDRRDLDMRRPNDIMREIAEVLDIGLVDLLDAFRHSSESPFLVTDEHLSPVGHRLLADALAECLAAAGQRSEVSSLTRGFSAERYPMPSQDGTLLTYQALVDGNMELFLATPDLAQQRRLTFDDVDQSHPMLSQDNSQVVFTSGSAASQRTEVVLMDVDGASRRVVTSEPDVFGAIPAFSPTNLHLAYAEWLEEGGKLTNPRIVIIDAATGVKRYVTDQEFESWRPVFSPDGATLFYISKRPSQFDVYAFDLHSRAEHRITHTEFDEWDPQVSPDGRTLVYAGRMEGNWDLFLLDLNSGSSRQLTRTKGDEWDPSFTRDGLRILFAGKFGPREGMFWMAAPR